MALIDQEAALEICEKEYQERLRMLDYCGDTVAWNIGGAIKALPTIDAAPVVHGRWIRQNSHNPEAICSYCGRDVVYQAISGRWAFEYFCPHCGARMDGGDGNEAG